jgi:4-hydroxybenzoate polyprenyltransferase
MSRTDAEAFKAEAAFLSLFQKILRFTKIEHTAFSIPLIFAGAWIGTRGLTPPPGVLLLVLVAAVGARIFGMSFNRIFDRRLDALNPRTAGRELPAGRLTLRTALAIAFGGLLVYLAACAALGGWCLVLAPLPLVPLLGYSLLKRFTALCHFGIGLCLAFVATTGNPNFTPPAVFFSFFVFCWLSGSDIVYALMDLESDRQTGVHSLPVWLGTDGALCIAGLLHAVAFGCLTAVFFLTGGRGPAALALALSGMAMVAMYLPSIPLGLRFFPVSTIAGIAAAMVPILGHFP